MFRKITAAALSVMHLTLRGGKELREYVGKHRRGVHIKRTKQYPAGHKMHRNAQRRGHYFQATRIAVVSGYLQARKERRDRIQFRKRCHVDGPKCNVFTKHRRLKVCMECAGASPAHPESVTA